MSAEKMQRALDSLAVHKPDDTGFLLVFGLGAALFGAFAGFQVGHDFGVKHHAVGKYVVVDMPDGSRQVCKVKKEVKQ